MSINKWEGCSNVKMGVKLDGVPMSWWVLNGKVYVNLGMKWEGAPIWRWILGGCSNIMHIFILAVLVVSSRLFFFLNLVTWILDYSYGSKFSKSFSLSSQLLLSLAWCKITFLHKLDASHVYKVLQDGGCLYKLLRNCKGSIFGITRWRKCIVIRFPIRYEILFSEYTS